MSSFGLGVVFLCNRYLNFCLRKRLWGLKEPARYLEFNPAEMYSRGAAELKDIALEECDLNECLCRDCKLYFNILHPN